MFTKQQLNDLAQQFATVDMAIDRLDDQIADLQNQRRDLMMQRLALGNEISQLERTAKREQRIKKGPSNAAKLIVLNMARNGAIVSFFGYNTNPRLMNYRGLSEPINAKTFDSLKNEFGFIEPLIGPLVKWQHERPYVLSDAGRQWAANYPKE